MQSIPYVNSDSDSIGLVKQDDSYKEIKGGRHLISCSSGGWDEEDRNAAHSDDGQG